MHLFTCQHCSSLFCLPYDYLYPARDYDSEMQSISLAGKASASDG